jgi:hypothetical protein
MERHTTTLEAGKGDSPNPWSGDDDDDKMVGLMEEVMICNTNSNNFHNNN